MTICAEARLPRTSAGRPSRRSCPLTCEAEVKVRHPHGGGPPLSRIKMKSVTLDKRTGIYYLDLCVDALDTFESGGGGWDMFFDPRGPA